MVAACRPDRLRSHPPHYIEPSSGSPRSQSIFRIGLAVQGIVGRESCPNRKRSSGERPNDPSNRKRSL